MNLNLTGLFPLPPQGSASANSATTARLQNLSGYFFFGGACCSTGAGTSPGFAGVKFNGIVLLAPGCCGSLNVTDGCPGLASPVAGEIVIGTGPVGSVVVVVDCFGAAAAGCLSKIDVPAPAPARREARIESDRDVTMHRTAETVG